MADLIANSGHLSPSELKQRKEELRQKHQHQLNQFDDMTRHLVQMAERDLLPYLDAQQTDARLRLKEKQMREIAEAMKEFSSQEELAKQYDKVRKKTKTIMTFNTYKGSQEIILIQSSVIFHGFMEKIC